MKGVILLCLLLVLCGAQDSHLESLMRLQKLKGMELITDSEYETYRQRILDSYIGIETPTAKKYKHYREQVRPNAKGVKAGGNSTWIMPLMWSPQVEWLVNIFDNNMPRSYDDTLPFTGKLYWKTKNYLGIGALNFNRTRLPLDDMVAIQERALTHVGLNLYDAGVWSIALTLSGLGDLVNVYTKNTLYTSGSGSNPQVGGLKSIRAWEPNPDPDHPPDAFYYGRDKIKNTEIQKIKMPGNVTFIMFQEGCTCPTAGCCQQQGVDEIPGNYFYRMIGPTYLMRDPLDGFYGADWRASPAGPNPDPAQYWNLAGVIHWNDWKPITGENVWGAILGPLQFLFLKNCSHIPTFGTFDDAPYEVQLAISIMPALEALQSPLGSMYHCPLGTKMYPPDDSEQTNVSNENNFSAWASFKALAFILDTFYTGGDPDLDAAKATNAKLLAGLDTWFASYLLPAPINGENVVSQGGHVSFDGTYDYQKGEQAFAIDCQTWGLLVVGQKRFDANYAPKGITAYSVWQAAKKLGGYYINGELAGVGYTIPNDNQTAPDIWSGEWTWGAVFMTRKVSNEYRAIGKTAWADDMLADSNSMIRYMQKAVVPDDDGVWTSGGLVQNDGSYLYANKRFFIPWGWYANPIGATSSTAWAVFNDFNYNPFMLGGGNNSTFWGEQCMDNPPADGFLDKVYQYYGY